LKPCLQLSLLRTRARSCSNSAPRGACGSNETPCDSTRDGVVKYPHSKRSRKAGVDHLEPAWTMWGKEEGFGRICPAECGFFFLVVECTCPAIVESCRVYDLISCSFFVQICVHMFIMPDCHRFGNVSVAFPAFHSLATCRVF
jgi:hypothetical protein